MNNKPLKTNTPSTKGTTKPLPPPSLEFLQAAKAHAGDRFETKYPTLAKELKNLLEQSPPEKLSA